MLEYLFVLLPVATTCGWYLGKKKRQQEKRAQTLPGMSSDYFKGLNYLINEQSDKAIDVFIKLLSVDADMIETHLALGSLFRRRGEVERAIRIHQNIIARADLDPAHRLTALSELGQDYLRAGMLDRSERLFLELIELEENNLSHYRFLLSIYQQEKDWLKAIHVAKKLQRFGEPLGFVIAQYYCELAEYHLEHRNAHQTHFYLKKAQSYHAGCVRATLLHAQLEYKDKNYKAAIDYYQKAVNQDLSFLPEVIASLAHCYEHLQAEKKMLGYFRSCLLKYRHVSLVLAVAGYLQTDQGEQEAMHFMESEMRHQPSLWGLKYLLKSHSKKMGFPMTGELAMMDNWIDKIIGTLHTYRCTQCGFSSKKLYWLCPSCHQWESVKPVHLHYPER